MKKSTIIPLIIISAVILFWVVLFLPRLEHVQYISITVNRYEYLKNYKIPPKILNCIPQSANNILLRYNRSNTSVFVSFNISEDNFNSWSQLHQIEMSNRDIQKSTVMFSMMSITKIPEHYEYYQGQDRLLNNKLLEIIYDGNTCLIYSLGDF